MPPSSTKEGTSGPSNRRSLCADRGCFCDAALPISQRETRVAVTSRTSRAIGIKLATSSPAPANRRAPSRFNSSTAAVSVFAPWQRNRDVILTVWSAASWQSGTVANPGRRHPISPTHADFRDAQPPSER